MTKIMLLQWLYNVCICITPICFVFDMVAVYGYNRLHYLGKRVYKSYLVASMVFTAVLVLCCLTIVALRIALKA